MLALVIGCSLMAGCTSSGGIASGTDSSKAESETAQAESEAAAKVPDVLKISWYCTEMEKEGLVKEIPLKALELMEKAVGTKIEIQPVLFTWDTYNEKIKLYIASKNFDDVFYLNDSAMIDELGQAGLILNLEDYKDAAPNFFNHLDNGYQYNRVINGTNIFGYVNLPSGDEGTQWVWADRFDIFKKHNLEHPKTLDDLYNVCKELKTLYPDSYPLGSGVAATWYGVAMTFFNINKTSASFYFDGEQYKYGPIDDEEAIKATLQYLNKLYSEKLLDPEYMTVTDEQVIAKMVNSKNFIIPNWWCAEINKDNTDEVEWGIVARPTNFKGERGWKPSSDQGKNPPIQKVGFVVDAATEYPELVVKAVDSLYSQEGIDLKWWGIKDKTYIEKEGIKEFVKPYNDMNDLFAETGFGKFPNVAIDNNVTRLELTPCYADGEYVQENGYKFTDRVEGSESIAPRTLPLNFTKEENDKINPPTTTLNTYFDEMCDKFITGKESFDNWDKFMEQLKKSGDYQAVLDVMNNKVAEFKAANP